MRQRWLRLVCRLRGHVEYDGSAYLPGAVVHVRGCGRCGAPLEQRVYQGRYPVPRGEADA